MNSGVLLIQEEVPALRAAGSTGYLCQLLGDRISELAVPPRESFSTPQTEKQPYPDTAGSLSLPQERQWRPAS